MTVTLFLFICIYLMLYAAKISNSEKSMKVFFVWAAILLIAVLGSRNAQYGFADSGVYYNFYKNYIGKSFDSVSYEILSSRDWGFGLLTWGLAKIVPWTQFFLYFEIAILVVVLFGFIYRNSLDSYMSIVVLFASGLIAFCLSAFRQAIAISFCMISYEYLVERNELRNKFINNLVGLISFFVAFIIHKSSIAFIVAIVIGRTKSIRLKVITLLCGTMVLVIGKDFIFSSAAEYLEKNYVASFEMSMVGHTIQLSVLVLPVLLLFITGYFRNVASIQQATKFGIINDTDYQESYIVRSVNMVLLSAFAFVIYSLRTYAQGFERIAYYFYPFTAIAYTLMIEHAISERSKDLMRLICAGLLIMLTLWRTTGTFVFFWQ